MDSETAVETGDKLFRWLNDYGALQLLAIYGIIRAVTDPILIIWIIIKIGRPVARIADELEKARSDGG